MEIYTLDHDFLPNEFITEFTSVIWTERYSSAGDVEIVVSATSEMVDALSPGTFLGLKGTKEIMVLDTHSIENNLLTVKGTSLVRYLNEREAWFPNPAYDGTDTNVSLAAEYTTDTQAAGAFLADVLNRTVISPAAFGSYWSPINFDWANDAIAGLALGLVDGNGTVKRLSFPLGPLYDGIENFASAEHLGFKLYLESAVFSTHTHVLRFATYRGKNRTSDQIVNSMVRLTPQMDSLLDAKEIRSIANFKNVVYVNYKNQVSIHYIGSSTPTGFGRRVLRVDAPDIYLDPSHIAAFRDQVAYNAFVQHSFIQAVDGEVSTQPGYIFEKDYYLGDVVELEGTTGLRSQAQVTEYIRTQDKAGFREYPTLSLIDPLLFDFEADLEPDPDFEIPWFDDPEFIFDPPEFPVDPFDFPEFPEDHMLDPATPKKPRKRHKKPGSPDSPDYNPDPAPDFTKPTGPTLLVVGYYPDQDKGEAIGKITVDGELVPLWIYTSEDPDSPAEDNWEELKLIGWTPDHSKIIAYSDDSKDPTTAFPWSHAYAYWLMNPDGTERTRLTETDPLIAKVRLWAASASDKHMYIDRAPGVEEFLYADGTYSTDPTLHDRDPVTHNRIHTIDDPGPRISQGKGIEVHHTTTTLSDLELIIGTGDISAPELRWSQSQIYPSPNGSKLLVGKPRMRIYDTHKTAVWNVGLSMSGTESLYTIKPQFGIGAGKIGDYLGGIWNFAVDWDSTALALWNGVLDAAKYEWEFAFGAGTKILDDPRDYPGWPDSNPNPYGGGPLNVFGAVATLWFHVLPDEGVWLDVNNHDLVNDIWLGAGIAPYNLNLTETIQRWYLCNPDGSSLTELDFDSTLLSQFGGWSPDSAKLHGVAKSEDGHDYCRWLVYDVSSGDISFPIDYSSDIGSSGFGHLQHLPIISPDGSKVVWIKSFDDGSRELWHANVDGSSAALLYGQTVDFSYDDQDVTFIGNSISWNFDNTKIAVVDSRDPAPVWIFNVTTGVRTKVWAGSGWDNPDDQQWIYDLVNFNG